MKFEEETYMIIGAAMEVHKELGCGFLEAVYQEALEQEFKFRRIQYVREKQLKIFYKKQELSKAYVADFVCFDKIILEIKALSCFTNEHFAQLINYLKASSMEVGLLINFGTINLQHKRFIYDNKSEV